MYVDLERLADSLLVTSPLSKGLLALCDRSSPSFDDFGVLPACAALESVESMLR